MSVGVRFEGFDEYTLIASRPMTMNPRASPCSAQSSSLDRLLERYSAPARRHALFLKLRAPIRHCAHL